MKDIFFEIISGTTDLFFTGGACTRVRTSTPLVRVRVLLVACTRVPVLDTCPYYSTRVLGY
jgi:hypothetical protein